MFEFQVNDRLPGDTIQLAEPTGVHLQCEIRSQYNIDLAEVVYNGQVVATSEVASGANRIALDKTIAIERSGWIAVRASGPRHRAQPGGVVYGHTSPVYLEVAGRPLESRADAEYFVAWIDRLQADIRRRNRIPSRHQLHVETQIAAARAVYNRLREVTAGE